MDGANSRERDRPPGPPPEEDDDPEADPEPPPGRDIEGSSSENMGPNGGIPSFKYKFLAVDHLLKCQPGNKSNEERSDIDNYNREGGTLSVHLHSFFSSCVFLLQRRASSHILGQLKGRLASGHLTGKEGNEGAMKRIKQHF